MGKARLQARPHHLNPDFQRKYLLRNIIVKPIITWTLTVGEVRNLASEGVGFGSPKVFTYIRALL